MKKCTTALFKTRSKRVYIILLVICCTVCSATSAQNIPSPKDIVIEYCRLDSGGARISSAGDKSIRQLYSWKFEPGWDSVIIISGFTVKEVYVRDDSAAIRVDYDVLGILGGHDWIPADTDDKIYAPLMEKGKTVNFRLIKTNNVWKINSPVVHPHVSIGSMLKHLDRTREGRIGRENDYFAEAYSEMQKLFNKIRKKHP
ncbi:hypothetical protein ACFL6L_03610 [candidate division KSB1 bacterium]